MSQSETVTMTEGAQTMRETVVPNEMLVTSIGVLLGSSQRMLDAQNRYDALNLDDSLAQQEAEIKAKMELIEGEMYFEVSSEVDPETKKPVYSNETKRNLEVKIRCGKDAEWIKLADEYNHVKRANNERKMKLGGMFNTINFIKNEHFANKAILEVAAALAIESAGLEARAMDKLSRLRTVITQMTERDGTNG